MQTIYLIADEPAAVADTLAIIDRANDAAFDCVMAGPAELLHFCDNLDSGNCASYFETHMAEYYRRRLGQLHAAGKVAAVHLDGAVRGLLPRLAACGFDGIESITPAPVGDVEIEDLRRVAGNEQTILWLDALWPAGRLVVASADQVPPDGDVDFCRVVAETIETY